MTSPNSHQPWYLRYRYTLTFVFITFTTLLTYSNSFHNSWHFDDYDNIVYNQDIQDWDHLALKFHTRRNRMLGYFSLALDYAFHGSDVTGYHLTNFAIHLLSSLLVWQLTLALLSTPGFHSRFNKINLNHIALVAAAVFLLHPIQTQSINYIIQRFTPLVALLYLLGTFLYLKARQEKDPVHRIVLFILTLASFVLAMATKENAYTWPATIILLETICFPKKIRLKPRHIILGAIFLVAFFLFMDHEYSLDWFFRPKFTRLGETAVWWNYGLTQFRVLLTYTRLLFIPLGLNFDYYYPLSITFFEPAVVSGFLFLSSLLFVSFRFLRKRPEISLGILWMLVTLSVESTIIPIEDVIFEHRLYLPLFGFVFALSPTLFLVFSRHKTKFYSALVILLLCLSGLTYLRNRVWRTELSLWQDTVTKSPLKPRVHNQVGVHYQTSGDLQQAIYHYQKTLELQPDHPDAHYNLGQAMLALGELDQAKAYFLRSYQLDPDITRAFYFIGFIQLQQGHLDAALENIDRAIKGEPDLAKAYNLKGDILVLLDRPKEARPAYQAAVNLEPANPEYRSDLISLDSPAAP